MVGGTPAGRQPPSSSALVGGRYEIGTLLGSGGTAGVYRAHDTVLDREVALKLFHAGVVGSDRRRFEQEVRLLARMRHPGVVTTYDAGTHEDRAFLVMELVEGRTLADRIAEGALPVGRTIALGGRMADTLAYMAARGITHRDLKPGNVLLGPDGPLITDFGIARVTDSSCGTESGVIIGTAGYMAPEQVRGEAVGPPADVFALGLVLLECVTGYREYRGGPVEAAVARLHRAPRVPDGLPEGLTVLLRRMTAADPAARPSAREVAALLPVRPALGSTRPIPMVRARRVARRRRPSRGIAALSVAFLAACLLAVAYPATLDLRDAIIRVPAPSRSPNAPARFPSTGTPSPSGSETSPTRPDTVDMGGGATDGHGAEDPSAISSVPSTGRQAPPSTSSSDSATPESTGASTGESSTASSGAPEPTTPVTPSSTDDSSVGLPPSSDVRTWPLPGTRVWVPDRLLASRPGRPPE